MCLVNLTARNATVAIQPKTIKINNTPMVNANFIQDLEKEVMNLNKKEKKEAHKKLSQILSVFMSTLTITTPTFAANSIVSSDLINLFLQAIGACVALAVLVGTFLLILTGVWQMFNAERASEMRQNIIKGLIQSLVAPLIVMVIVYLGHLLFSDNSYYIDPYQMIPTFRN